MTEPAPADDGGISDWAAAVAAVHGKSGHHATGGGVGKGWISGLALKV